jgi:nitrogen-specific signal transduction histidine kinase
VVRDITERKQAQEERERLEVQLRQAQKMEAVGQLAGGVAHDFNNLLQVILGNNEMAIAASGPNEAVGEHLQEIKSAAERAGSLVRQLLTFSRRVPLRLEPLNLETIIFDLGRMLRRLIGEHIDLDMGTAKSLHAIYADRGQIEQVFVNLCVNARDAMPDGGRIVIRVENTPRCDAAFDCQIHPPPLGFVRLTVSDNGVGMAKEIQEHIFEPFFTTKEVGKGTGLGLSTVYSILQRHEGHLHLTSEPGRGTFFQLYFPAKKPVATQEAAVNLASPAPGEGEMILLAEDEEMVRNLAVRVLGKGGYQVLAASDGEMALRIFEQHGARIRLAVLDVLMPRKNGSAVFRALKLANPELPCLFTTGYSYGALEQEHLPADTPIIQKPYLPAELLRQVQAILNK